MKWSLTFHLKNRRRGDNKLLEPCYHLWWSGLGSHGSVAAYAQEKPEREEQPDRAPAGMDVPLTGWLLVAERIFLMFAL